MVSTIEKRISCGICSAFKSVTSTTNTFDYGLWKEISVKTEDDKKTMFICDGCINIFRALFDEWYESKKPQKPKMVPKEKVTKKKK